MFLGMPGNFFYEIQSLCMKNSRGAGWWYLPSETIHLIFWQTAGVLTDCLHLSDLRLCVRHYKDGTLYPELENICRSPQRFLTESLGSFTKVSPFGILFTPIVVCPTNMSASEIFVWFLPFCLALGLLPCVAYKSTNTWRGHSPLLFYHFQNIPVLHLSPES